MLPGPIGEQGVVNVSLHAGAVRWGTRLRTSSLQLPSIDPTHLPLSLRADKRERPEPSWPLDVPALYTRYVQYVARVASQTDLRSRARIEFNINPTVPIN